MDESPSLSSVSLASSYAHYLEQLSDEEFWEHARQRVQSTPSPPSPIEAYLMCEIEHQSCILPLTALHEVVPIPHYLTLLPDAPTWMPGVATWRGQVIPVINLEAYLSFSSTPPPTDGMLLIAHHNDILLGLLVSVLRSTITLETEKIVPLAQDSSLRIAALKGIYTDALILDIPAILMDVVQHVGKNYLL